MSKELEEYSNMDILRLQKDDVLVAYFDWNEIDIEQAVEMHNALTQVLPKGVSVVTMPDIVSLLGYDKETFTTEMLFQIEKVLGKETYIEALKNELARINNEDLL